MGSDWTWLLRKREKEKIEMSPLADLISTDEFESWTDEESFFIHLINNELTIRFTPEDFAIFVKNIVKTYDVSKYLIDLK